MHPRSLLFTLLLLLPALARADADAPAREAALRFDRGLALVNAGDLSGGLAEFQRAYALSPSPRVLLNLGLLRAELGRPVEATHALDEALRTPDALTAPQRDRAAQVLREQRAKIGRVRLHVNVSEGAVQVDNVEVARLPLAGPLEVASGVHVIGVVAEAHAPARKEVVVAADSEVDCTLQLVAIDARLAHIVLHSPLPDAEVFVDGERVGSTPLEASITVLPGTREVVLARAGYESARRSLSLGQGATAELTLAPHVDGAALAREGGTLRILASESDPLLAIDENPSEPLLGPIVVPHGRHRLRLERGGFLPAERDVAVPRGLTSELHWALAPTPETRALYMAKARRRRAWSWVGLGAGAALAGGGVGLALAEAGPLRRAEHAYDLVRDDWKKGAGGSCDSTGDFPPDVEVRCRARLDHASDRVHRHETRRALGWAGAGVGAALLVTGALLLATAPSLHKYDAKPARAPRVTITPIVALRSASVGLLGSYAF